MLSLARLAAFPARALLRPLQRPHSLRAHISDSIARAGRVALRRLPQAAEGRSQTLRQSVNNKPQPYDASTMQMVVGKERGVHELACALGRRIKAAAAEGGSERPTGERERENGRTQAEAEELACENQRAAEEHSK